MFLVHINFRQKANENHQFRCEDSVICIVILSILGIDRVYIYENYINLFYKYLENAI